MKLMNHFKLISLLIIPALCAGCAIKPGSGSKSSSHTSSSTSEDPSSSSLPISIVEPEVQSIKIINSSDEIQLNSSLQLDVSINPGDAPSEYVVSVSDPNIISVEDNILTGLKVGACDVTVTSLDNSEATDTKTFYVEDYLVTRINLSIQNESGTETTVCDLGHSLYLSATLKPVYAANKKLQFISSNPEVVNIANEGKTSCELEAVRPGKSTITAKAIDGSGIYKEVEICVESNLVASISLSPNDTTMEVGSSIKLNTSIAPETPTVPDIRYYSTNSKILSVDQSGNVYAIAPGTASIKATSTDSSYVEGECTVVVIPREATDLSVQDINSNNKIYTGESYFLTVNSSTVDDSFSYLYESNDPSVISVDENGLITALKAGKTTIIVTQKGNDSNYTISNAIEVLDKNVSSLVLSATSKTLYVNDSYQINSVVLPSYAYYKFLSYTSSDASVASVNSNGLITARKAGSATIRVSTNDGSGVYEEISVTVKDIPVTDITTDKSDVNVFVGDSYTLNPTIYPFNASNSSVQYSSSDASIASVNESGVVKGVKKGNAVITISAGSKMLNVNIHVSNKLVESIVGVVESTSLTIGQSEVISYLIEPSGTLDQTVSITSDHPEIVSVTDNVITAVSIGNATITIEANDGSAVKDEIVISVVPEVLNSIILENNETVLYLGETLSLKSKVFPLNSDYVLSYSSSNESVASVDANGVVTANAISDEMVSITVTAKNTVNLSEVSASLDLYVRSDVPSALLAEINSSVIAQNSTTYVTYGIAENYACKDVTFTSEDPSIATVSSTGLVTGIAPGITKITVTSTKNPLATSEVEVTVTSILTNLAFINHSENVVDNETYNLKDNIVLNPTSAKDILLYYDFNENYISINNNLLTVNDLHGEKKVTTVNVYALGASGSSLIESMKFYINGATDADVDKDQKVESITLNETSITMKEETVKTTFQIETTLTPSLSKTIYYKSTNPSVASVSDTGLVTANRKGEADILVYVNDGGQASATLHVSVINDKVSKIELSSSKTSLRIGEDTSINYNVLPLNAVDKTLVWTSSDTNVATINTSSTSAQSGSVTVTAVANGKTKISAMSADGSSIISSILIEVGNIKAESISIPSLTYEAGVYKIQLNENQVSEDIAVNILPVDTANKELLVTTSKSSVATASLDNNNQLTISAHDTGKATITLKTKDGSNIFAYVEVTVISNKVSDISLDVTSPEVEATKSITVGVIVSPSYALDKTYNILVKNSTIAGVTVDSNNNIVITGKKVGRTDVTLTAKDGSNVSLTFVVNVYQINVSSISITPTSLALIEGDTPTQLSVELTGEGGKTPTISSVSYRATNDCVSISSTGLVTALSSGEGFIIVSATDGSGVTSSIPFTVTNKNIKSITLSGSSEVKVEENVTLSTSYSPSDSPSTIKYEVGDSSILEIVSYTNSQVVIKGKKVGSTWVRAVSQDSDGIKSDKFFLSVPTILPESVSIVPGTTQTISVNETLQLSASLSPSGVSDKSVVWSSSDKSIVKVNANGLITGIANGSATITCTCNAKGSSGQTISSSIKVNVVWVSVQGIAITNKITTLYVGESHTFTTKFTPDNPSKKTVSWSLTGNTTSATLTSDGKLTGNNVGTVTATCLTGEGGYYDTCTVNIVMRKVSKITTSATEFDLKYGQSLNVDTLVTVLPANATNKSFSLSTLEGKVTIYGNQVIAGSVSGDDTVIISANDGSGVTALIFIHVIAHDRPVVTIASSGATINYGQSWTVATCSATSSTPGVTIVKTYASDSTTGDTLTIGSAYAPTTAGDHVITYRVTDSTGVDGKASIVLKVIPVKAENTVTTAENDLSNLTNYGTFKETFTNGLGSPFGQKINDGQILSHTSWYMTGGSEAINGNSVIVDVSKLYGHAMTQLFFPISKDYLPEVGYSFKLSFTVKFVKNAQKLSTVLDYGTGTNPAWNQLYVHYQYDGAPSGYDLKFLKSMPTVYGDGTTDEIRISVDMPGCECPSGKNLFFSFFIFGSAAGFSDVRMAVDDFEISTYKLPSSYEVSQGYTWRNASDAASGNFYLTNSVLVNKTTVDPTGVLNNYVEFGDKLAQVTSSSSNDTTCAFSGLSGKHADWMNGITYNNLYNSSKKYMKVSMYIYLNRTQFPTENFLSQYKFVVRSISGVNKEIKGDDLVIDNSYSSDSLGVFKVDLYISNLDSTYFDLVIYAAKSSVTTPITINIGCVEAVSSAAPLK